MKKMWIVRYKLNNSIQDIYFKKPKFKSLYTFNSTLKQWKEHYKLEEYKIRKV